MSNRPRALVLRLLVCVGLALGLVSIAGAHEARPLVVDITEQPNGEYHVRLRTPPSVVLVNRPRLVWPDGCSRRPVLRTGLDRGGAEAAHAVACEAPLEGRAIRIEYPVYNPSISTIARFEPEGGEPRTAVLPPDTSEWIVPAAPEKLQVAIDYLRLGVEHILAGFDHLLFVVGLLLLARTGGRILLVVTGFTIGHSITLSLSALGLVKLAVPPVEAAIALSIVFLAAEIAKPESESLGSRYPLLISWSFGLLHGLGFAAALGEVGLPPSESTTALLFFNLGVEAGQLAFITPLLLLPWLCRRLAAGVYARAASAARIVLPAVPYGIGTVAGFWLIERVAAF